MNFQNEDYIQYSNKKKNKETRSIAWYLTTHITLYILLIFFLIFFAWYTWFLVTHRYYIVEGPSMQPTLNEGIFRDTDSKDAVYINIYGKIEFGDIVVIEADYSIIKRVMATAGDYVTIVEDKSQYYVHRIPKEEMIETDDGLITDFGDSMARLEENERNFDYSIDYDAWFSSKEGVSVGEYIYEASFYNKFLKDSTYNTFTSENGLIYVEVPQDSVFCLGDNRGNSKDSRSYGFFDLDQVVGNVDIIVYDYSFGNRILQVIGFYYRQVEEFFAR